MRNLTFLNWLKVITTYCSERPETFAVMEREEFYIYSPPSPFQLYVNPVDITVVRWVFDSYTAAKTRHDGSANSSETGGLSSSSDEVDRLGSPSDLIASMPFAAVTPRKKRYSSFHHGKIFPQPTQVEFVNYCMQFVRLSDEETDIEP